MVSALSPAGGLEGFRPPLHQAFVPATPVQLHVRPRIHTGCGQPVLVFPRHGAGPESTASLRRVLGEAGFRPRDWGQGKDQGPGVIGLERWLRKLEEAVIDTFVVTQQPVTLLGWGLSGIYARELAKRATPLVRQVITLGTPFNTAADPQRTCPVLAMLDGGERLPLAARLRLRQKPPVPCTSVYSRDDGVVRVEQCLEKELGDTENVEIPGARHHELATHPLALEVITHRLAQPEGAWAPFGQAEPLAA
jgi:pimeloyl-ACP methyl ester carboxylesterase